MKKFNEYNQKMKKYFTDYWINKDKFYIKNKKINKKPKVV
jgi:hypothetical protein